MWKITRCANRAITKLCVVIDILATFAKASTCRYRPEHTVSGGYVLSIANAAILLQAERFATNLLVGLARLKEGM